MTAVPIPTPKDRTLLWAAGVGALWTALLVGFMLGCATGFTRPDNLVAIAIAVGCVGLMGRAALRHSDASRAVGQLAAGVFGGMFVQPSIGLLLAVLFAGLAVRDAWKSGHQLLGIALIVIGFGLGILVTYGLLPRFFAPTDIHC